MSTPPAQTPRPLRDLWTLLRDAQVVQYYATFDGVPPGKVLHIAASDWTHECWIFNPDDWSSLPPIAGLRWMHLRDAPPKWPAELAVGELWKA